MSRRYAICVAFLLALASGCSPSSLFSSKPDPLPAPQYHPVNSACANLDLRSPDMKGHELKAMLNCFNAYGALDPMKRLFDRLSDAQLDAFVRMGNQYIIGDRSFLFDVERSYFDEKTAGTLDPAMQSVSRAFENPDLVASALSLLDGGSDAALSNEAIGIVRTLGKNLSPQSMSEMLSLGMSIGSSRALYSLQEELKANQDSAPSDLQTLVDAYLEMLRESQAPGSFSLLDALNRNYQSGDLPIALDTLFGMDEKQVARDIPPLSPIFPVLGQKDGEVLMGLGRLARALSSPLKCLRGTQQDPDPVMHLFQDIANQPDGSAGEFLARNKALTLAALEPICSFPPTLEEDYSKVIELANSPAMYGAERAIKAAFAVHDAGASSPRPIARMIQDFLADPKTEQLVPFLQDLSSDEEWENALLLLSLPNNADRDRAFAGLAVLDQIKDPLTDLILANGSEPLLSLAKAAKSYVNQRPSFLYPMLDGLRGAYYTDDAHPFVNLLSHVMANAPQEKLFFHTLFSMSKYPEFRQSLSLLSAMAKDGRLKDMLGAFVALTHGFSEQGRHAVALTSVQPFSVQRRHNLDSADLADFPVTGNERPLAQTDCAQLMGGSSLAGTGESSFNRQWDRFLGCLSAQGSYEDVQSGVDYLRSQSTESGENDLAFGIGLVQRLNASLSKDDVQYLSDLWVQSVDDGNFAQGLKTAASFIQQQVIRPLFDLAAPLLGQARKTLDQLENFAAWILKRDDFPALAKETDALSRDVQGTELDPPMTSNPSAPQLESELPRVERWIRNKECENFPDDLRDNGSAADPVALRAQQVIKAYSDAPTAYLAASAPKKGVSTPPAMTLSLDQVKALTEPVLDRIYDPAYNDPDHGIVESILDFLKFYSLQPGQAPTASRHATPDDLARWFYERSTDRKLITQYYLPDSGVDPHPTVRYVDSLDRLELVLVNADFDELVPLLDLLGIRAGVNIGKLSLAEIGDSWGDEPENLWPQQIKDKYPNGDAPKLAQTIDHLESILEWMKVAVGFPKLPKCDQQADPGIGVSQDDLSNNEPICHPLPRLKLPGPLPSFPNLPGCMHLPDMPAFGLNQMKRRIYNLAQVFSVLRENLPGSGTPEDGGLKVLRDLFFELNYSSPRKYRSQVAGDHNNLSLVTFLAKTGLLEQIAFDLRRFPPPDSEGNLTPALRDFFGGLASLADDPSTPAILQSLVRDDSSHQLIWKLAGSLYPLLGNPLPLNEPPRMDALAAHQSIYYGLADLQQLGVVSPVLGAASRILQDHSDYVLRHTDIAPVLSETYVSRLTRALHDDDSVPDGKKAIGDIIRNAYTYLDNQEPDGRFLSDLVGAAQIIEDNPATQGAISTFLARLKQFNSDPGGENAAQLENIGYGLLSFFENPDGAPDSAQAQASAHIRAYLADRLSGATTDLDQVIYLVSRNPDQFENLLETGAKYSQNDGENYQTLEDFFAYIRNEMKPVN